MSTVLPSTSSVLTGIPSYVSVYDPIFEIIPAYIFTGRRLLHVCHWVTVDYFNLFFYILIIDDTLSDLLMHPPICLISQCFDVYLLQIYLLFLNLPLRS